MWLFNNKPLHGLLPDCINSSIFVAFDDHNRISFLDLKTT
jgi:hypothetical protein